MFKLGLVTICVFLSACGMIGIDRVTFDSDTSDTSASDTLTSQTSQTSQSESDHTGSDTPTEFPETDSRTDTGTDTDSSSGTVTETAMETETTTDTNSGIDTTFDTADTDTDTTDTNSGTDTTSATVDTDIDTTDTATGTDTASDTADTDNDTTDTNSGTDTTSATADTETDTEQPCPPIPAGTVFFEDNDDDISEWTFYGEVWGAGVTVDGQSFTGAWQGSTYYYSGLPDQTQTYVDFDDDIIAGDHLLLEFWTNCKSASSGTCRTGGFVEAAFFPYTNLGGYYAHSDVGAGWEEHQVPFVSDANFAGQNRLTFRLGYPDQEIQVGGIRLTNFGQLATEPRPECLPDTTSLYSDVEILNEPKTIATVDFEYLYDLEVNGSPRPTVTVSGELPGWLTFDSDDNIFHGVPAYGDEGTSGVITVTASNGIATDMRSFAVTVQVDPGLVGHWPMDETFGTVVGDVSGNNNDGTLYGDVSWQPSGGITGGALTLNSLSGSLDYVELPTVTELNDLQNVRSENRNYTIAAWVKPNGTPAAGDGYGIVQKSGFNTGIWFDENNCFNVTHAFESSILNAVSTTCGSNFWYHVALVFNNDYNQMNIYVNGFYEAGAFSIGTEPDHDFLATPWRFGLTDPGASTMLGNVTLDDVRIYNRVLSAGEVGDLAHDYTFFL